MGSERIDMHAAAADLIEIGQAVGKSKSQFLGRGAASIANVVAAHRKRRPFRQIVSAIFDDVRRQLDCSFRRKDVGAASKVLFEHIVLDEHSGVPNIHTLFLKGGDVHCRDNRTYGVGGCANLANPF